MDRELLLEAVLVQAWGSPPDRPADINDKAEWFREAISNICDVAMPRVRPGCIHRRHRRRYIRPPCAAVIEVELYEGCREARPTLRAEIVKLKNEAYMEFR